MTIVLIETPNAPGTLISRLNPERKNGMMWNGAPGLCLKMPTASGNTSKILQRTPSLTIKKLAQ